MEADEVVRAIEGFGATLKGVLAEKLGAVAIYGSLAKGDYDPASSDHNVVLVLEGGDAATLRAVARTMRRKRPSRRTGLLMLARDELEPAREAFPLKLRDIARHHRLVTGEPDPFAELAFEPEHLRQDCTQQLQSLRIRVRRLFVRGESSPDILRTNLVASFRGFLPPAAGLVELLGERAPDTKQSVIAATAKVLDVSPDPLTALRRWTTDDTYAPSEQEVDGILDGYARTLQAAARRAASS